MKLSYIFKKYMFGTAIAIGTGIAVSVAYKMHLINQQVKDLIKISEYDQKDIYEHPQKYLESLTEAFKRKGLNKTIIPLLTDHDSVFFVNRNEVDDQIYESIHSMLTLQWDVDAYAHHNLKKTHIKFIVCDDNYNPLPTGMLELPENFFERNVPDPDILWRSVFYHEIAHTSSLNQSKTPLYREANSDYQSAKIIEMTEGHDDFMTFVKHRRGLDVRIHPDVGIDSVHQTADLLSAIENHTDTIPETLLHQINTKAIELINDDNDYAVTHTYQDLVDRRLFSALLTLNILEKEINKDLTMSLIKQRIQSFVDAVEYFAPKRYQRVTSDFETLIQTAQLKNTLPADSLAL